MAIKINKLPALLCLISGTTIASPIDWNGSLTYDTHLIRDVRRTGDDCSPTAGSQCIDPSEDNARFQSMIIKLNPNIIVNDGVTVKGELSTGFGRTANLGDSTQVDQTSGEFDGGAYYSQNTSSSLNVNQLYAEIYADTATYKIGRFSKNWGLGAVINDGSNPTDRFYSGYEGVEAQLKLGSFHLTPMWAKLHTSDQPNGHYDAYESSIAALYDNTNRDLQVGVYYSIKEVETDDTLYGKGSQNVNLIDVYLSKSFGDFNIALEVPMLSGKINDLYGTGDADFDSSAYIIETSYQLNSKWKLGLNGGMVKGDDGSSDSFEGMYLNPNYKNSYIMFKYNFHAFTSSDYETYDIYNASIVNTTYAQLYAEYNLEEWKWTLSALWAKANEVAENGKEFYNHEKMSTATGAADQSDDLGTEFSVAFDYRWNTNVTFGAYAAYHMVGDYYSFTNTDDDLSLSNVLASGMQLTVDF